ncbi:hypothetical protein D0809_08530 [Flavobacterium circumlabens]|uniref:Uncharacterized protein n=1 Tax=Flavobacterium circumlabens TaxID=2133765 RepID=A0A4Y7UFP7_9FLAO|nr:hypothetical protein [Flavobacterium circumlabens]TCN59960.1 hypothetical protein EV142_102580 [Flavobacterium circumlabens]TEB45204.1 hypothetical protein D0809_08530 [Flavobacterium circumlabens]
MNSYSENLHSSVLASLESQESNKKKLDSQLNSSMFTLYYAEGAEIVTNDKSVTATKKYNQSQNIKKLATESKNISTNTLLSATQQNSYTSQSVTNVATSAANIQVAANAIVRLASDMGSIFSIVNAADYGTQIYQQSFEAYTLMNTTAYLAEVASQHAMETSASIAEVASSTVQDKAKVTDTAVDNLLKVATSDFTAIAAVVAAQNDAKAAASVTTKKAQGAIESNKVELQAAKVAYNLNNKSLNYNLKVHVPSVYDGSYNVSFDFYKPPFNSNEKTANTASLGLDNPVKSYNIFLVKDSKKSTFSALTAEEAMGNSLQYVQLIPSLEYPSETDPSKALTAAVDTSNAYFAALNAAKLSKEKVVQAKDTLRDANADLVAATKEKQEADVLVSEEKEEIAKLNKELPAAKEKATHTAEASKKEPKNADLSKAATDASRALTNLEQSLENAKLNETKAVDAAKVAADTLKIATTNVTNAKTNLTAAETQAENDQKNVVTTAQLAANSKREGFKNIQSIDLVDSDNEMLALGEKYVIFLLTIFTDDYKKGINTYDDFLSAPSETFSLKNTLKAVNDIAVEKEPARHILNPDLPVLSPYGISFTVDETDHKHTEYRCMFLSYNEDLFTSYELDYFEESIEVAVIKKEIQYSQNDISQFKEELKTITLKIKELDDAFQKEIKNLDPVKDKDKIKALTAENKSIVNNYSQVQTEINSKLLTVTAKLNELHLSFEKIMAEKLPKIKNKKGFFFNLKLAENVASGNYTTALPSSKHSLSYEAKIDPTTTDNFGNALIDGKLYIPVVLSVYSGNETNQNQYNNNLSDWENEEPFLFSITNNQ